MPSELTLTAKMLQRAKTPEDVFGTLAGNRGEQLDAIKTLYRRLARVVHPDNFPKDQAVQASQAFVRLQNLKTAAETAINEGTYGDSKHRVMAEPVVVRSKKRIYTIEQSLARGDIANLYRCQFDGRPGVFKVARNAADNDLIQAEASILRHLRTPDRPEATGFFPYLPEIIDSFGFREEGGSNRQANVLAELAGFYSLEEVIRAYPDGLSPKHMAWIWRQLLQALGYTHARGVIHGAVLPPHVLIHPSHDLLLVDWCYAVRQDKTTGAHIPAISEEYEAWYPPEVAAKAAALPGVDLFMSARLMVALMGGDPLTGELPRVVAGQTIQPRLRGLIKSCLLVPPRQRPQDAWRLRSEFTQLIEELWGPRQRIPFTMPAR